MKGLIIIPYAYGGKTGVNIQKIENQQEIYLKNICVAAISAKQNAGSDADVVVVSNIDIPEPYLQILQTKGICVDSCPFDKFNFGHVTKSGKNVRWQLAYYKLCALAHCLNKYKYDLYCFLDTDVFIQRTFDKIWLDARHNIMLYDVNTPVDGYIVSEINQFLGIDKPLTHYGGEFFAASADLTRKFVSECYKIYMEMIEADFVSDNGDEFITSIAAFRLKIDVKNAGAYIRRYWTGSWRLVCNDYDKSNIVVLHVPAEKEQGIIRIFDRFIKIGKVPIKEQVWSILHLRRTSLRVAIGCILRKVISLFRKQSIAIH